MGTEISNMRNIFIVLGFILFILFRLDAQTTFSSNCSSSSSIEKMYRTDAIRLSVARMNETNNPNKDSIEIPQDVYDSVMRCFTVMHNMQPNSLRDTLRNLFQFDNFTAILTAYPPAYEGDSTHFNSIFSGYPSSIFIDKLALSFGLEGDSSINWLKEWSLNNFNNTPNADINYLVSKYQLNVNYLGLFSGKQRFKISISGKQNIAALKVAFLSIEPSIDNDVYLNNNVFYIIDGNSLIALFDTNGIQLNYRNGCGDCPLGCTYGTQWSFYIPYDSCKLNYMGRSTWNSTAINPPICLRGAIMPIEFGNITTNKLENSNQINFTAITEVNIKAYEIERSNNAKDFVLINNVVAKNKNNSSYTVTDNNPLSGNNYYRIKAIENNGAIKYSKIVLVKNDAIQLNISPNPVSNYFIIESLQMKQINILDMQGKIVFTKTMNNTNIQKINISQFVKGFYLVQVISSNGEIKTEKLILQ